MAKTVIFEDKYNIKINKFSSTDQVTEFLEDKLDKHLEVISLNQNLVSKRGSVFPIIKNNVDGNIDKAIKLHSSRASKLLKKLKSNK